MLQEVVFRFYAELNDFLLPERRLAAFPHAVFLSASVKDMIESLGVPHTEVDFILVNGVPAGFGHLVRAGDRVSVCPAFSSLDVSSVMQLRPQQQDFRFIVDTHLGRLARYLRMLGFDALYEPGWNDRDLARISATQNRILLTRDRALLKRGEITYGYCVRATGPRRQIVEVLRRYHLFRAAAPFQRCLRCNCRLEAISKQSISDRLPPRTSQHYHDFRTCPLCERLYWAGPHYEHMRRFIERILESGCTGVEQLSSAQ